MMKQSSLRIAGFSLIELLVVLGVLSIMLAVGIANVPSIRAQANFSQTLSIMDQSISDMRTQAISIRRFRNNLYPGYGVAFDTTTGNNAQIIQYADCELDDNNDDKLRNEDSFIYTPGATSCGGGAQLVKNIPFPRGFTIKEIRYVLGSTVTTGITHAYVEYLRPEPSTWLTYKQNGTNTLIGAGRIEVDVGDATGKYQRTYLFWSSGLIDVR